jgi:hypothetical protein
MYKDLQKDIENFVLNIPETIVPVPSTTDYNLGYVYRYFIQKANDENSFIFEISETSFKSYQTNPFWKKIRLKWRIVGPVNSTYKNGEIDDRGVINSNKASLAAASSEIKNISLYLPNLLQFHKG